ncbi:pyridoxine 5'-phosphate synthase [Desulfocicer vacuolatum DSM 3385]|uniref:Pyridoxine 5'-phosphate synthase n=1 Tax=Desulfocicer vacuolatum DSM 3385 TaxID=1121400 RepID=A0A1W1YJR7_9BACT|nr:pyridoxine 5'-phosphate synthase [Desulfocicer vacuolatum]SMC36417.1 pyridoxine 5'-phosphate synthase [Desulfocicer vacuolatum DSM 3385]
MAKLAVNVDHIATLRQARGINYPEPVAAAVAAETAGADGIVVHLREDRRHIQERDVRILRQVVQSKLILEMAATTEMIGIALEVKPEIITLVPEKREELTTEGGLDLLTHHSAIEQSIATLKNAGMAVCIFIDPDLEQIKMAHKIDADMIEIHTGAFCDAKTEQEKAFEFSRIVDGAAMGHKLKLEVNAGHGLCYNTIKAFKGHAIIDEFSIGHSIVARATLTGMETAVRDMLALVKSL